MGFILATPTSPNSEIMNNNKIFVYEPNFSVNGHYKRYLLYIITLFRLSTVNNINSNVDIQKKINESSGISRIKIGLYLFFLYLKIFKYRKNFLIITSQGNPIFWIFAIILLENYMINIISAKPFVKTGIIKIIFNKFIKKSKFITFTDKFYRDKYYLSGLVLHDRLYKEDINIPKISFSTIKILGHIHEGRDPTNFINKYANYYKIIIIGKIDLKILQKLPIHKNLKISNKYLSEEDYKLSIYGSYIYLPVTEAYSEVMISGVFFDVIEGGGIPIIGSYGLYKEYIENNAAIDADRIDLTFKFNYSWYVKKIQKMNQETLNCVNEVLSK